MRYRIPPHVHHQRLHNEVILLDEKTDSYLGLNATAAIVWSTLVDGETLATAVELLIEHFEVEPTIASNDASLLVTDLVNRKLLEPMLP
jgi:hypothetical protein